MIFSLENIQDDIILQIRNNKQKIHGKQLK